MNLRIMVREHLVHNHFPPVPEAYIEPALAAIEAITEWRGDIFDMSDIDAMNIRLPDGLMTSARMLADNLHLWDFVDFPEADDA